MYEVLFECASNAAILPMLPVLSSFPDSFLPTYPPAYLPATSLPACFYHLLCHLNAWSSNGVIVFAAKQSVLYYNPLNCLNLIVTCFFVCFFDVGVLSKGFIFSNSAFFF